MILLIDNYDSFTYNLYHYLLELNYEVTVKRNDKINIKDINSTNFQAIVISPGPCTPNEAGSCIDIIKNCAADLAILGVCLGHQAIGAAYGANIIRGKEPMHAKVTAITHNDKSLLFKDIPTKFKATRYHSLIIEEASLASYFDITARSDDNVIQAIEHKKLPLYGVQFHPESIASEYGHEILQNFTDIAVNFQKNKADL